MEECERVAAECERLFGRLDFLVCILFPCFIYSTFHPLNELTNKYRVQVNNLGTYQHSSLETLTPEQFDSLMNTNLRAHVFLTRHTLHLLARSKSASVVNISSLSGLRPVQSIVILNANSWLWTYVYIVISESSSRGSLLLFVGSECTRELSREDGNKCLHAMHSFGCGDVTPICKLESIDSRGLIYSYFYAGVLIACIPKLHQFTIKLNIEILNYWITCCIFF